MDLPSSTVHECRLEIKNRRGLHARAAAKLVEAVARFAADVRIQHGTKEVMATSIMGLMFLGARQGTFIDIKANGPDAAKAMDAIKALIAENFFED